MLRIDDPQGNRKQSLIVPFIKSVLLDVMDLTHLQMEIFKALLLLVKVTFPRCRKTHLTLSFQWCRKEHWDCAERINSSAEGFDLEGRNGRQKFATISPLLPCNYILTFLQGATRAAYLEFLFLILTP